MRIFTNYDESRSKHAKRQEILENSYTLFLKSGIESVSMKDIAEHTNIQRRSLYNYYPNKEKIAKDLMKCVYYAMEEASFTEREKELTGGELLTQIVYSYQHFLMNNRDVLIYLTHFDHYFRSTSDDEEFQLFIAEMFMKIDAVEIFQKGVADGTIKTKYAGKELSYFFTMMAAILTVNQRMAFVDSETSVEFSNLILDGEKLIEMLLDAVLVEVE